MSDQTNAVLVSIETLNHQSSYMSKYAYFCVFWLVISNMKQFADILPNSLISPPSYNDPIIISVQSCITFTYQRHS